MLDLCRDLWDFAKVRKKFWMLPLIVVLVFLVGLLLMAQGSIIAPFVYALF
jgi:Family of unknown function (DUF5989)